MLVNYEGVERQFDMDEITVQQLKTLFSHMGGMTLASLEQGLQVGDPNSLTAIYWLMLQNNGENVPLDKVDFKVVRFFRALNDAAVAEKQKREGTARAKQLKTHRTKTAQD